MIIRRKVLLLISLGMLAVSLIFLTWVLQLPAATRAQGQEYKPAVGIVAVQVLSTPTPDPSVVEFCSSFPEELRQDCIKNTPADASMTPEEECSLLPEEMQAECLSEAQKQ